MKPMINNDEDYTCAIIELVGYTIDQGKKLEDLMEEITNIWFVSTTEK